MKILNDINHVEIFPAPKANQVLTTICLLLCLITFRDLLRSQTQKPEIIIFQPLF